MSEGETDIGQIISSLREIEAARKERVEILITMVIDIAKTLYNSFKTHVSSELTDMQREINSLEPLIEMDKQRSKFDEFESSYEKINTRLNKLISLAERGEITSLEHVDEDAISDGIELIFKVNDLRKEVDSSVRTFYRIMNFVDALMRRRTQENNPRSGVRNKKSGRAKSYSHKGTS